MGRGKGIFGRSKSGKAKKDKQQTRDSSNRNLESSSSSIKSLQSSNHNRNQEAPSPLLIAKAARETEIATVNLLEQSNHSVASSTIFIPVNEHEGSVSGSLKSSNSLVSKAVSSKCSSKKSKESKHAHSQSKDDQEIKSEQRQQLAQPRDEKKSMAQTQPQQYQPVNSYMQQPGAFRRFPSVSALIDRLVQVDDKDFPSCEKTLQLMKQALEMEGEMWMDRNSPLSFDPNVVFFAIQDCTERVTRHWMKLKAEREQQRIKHEQDEAEKYFQLSEGDNTTSTLGSDFQPSSFVPTIDDATWHEFEEFFWFIGQNALDCCEVLTTIYIGPSWHFQQQERKARIQAMKQERIRNFQSDMGSTTSRTHFSRRVSIHEEEELNVSDIDASMRNITITDQTHYPYIREMLPISILAFTAAIGDIIIPQMRNSDSVLILRRDTPISDDDSAQDSPSKRIDLRYYQNCIEKIMAEEINSYLRRQGLCACQRKISLALMTDEDKISTEEDIQQQKKFTLSIPSSHEPVACMMRNWVETALLGLPQENSYLLDRKYVLKSDGDAIEVKYRSIVSKGGRDWWETMQIASNIAALVSNGWRPPPEGYDGEETISLLLKLLKRALFVRPFDFKGFRGVSPKEPYSANERADLKDGFTYAICCASEIAMALKKLGERAWLPVNSIKEVSMTMCYLISSSEASRGQDLFPIQLFFDPHDSRSLEDFYEQYVGEKNICQEHFADLLYNLMIRHSSMSSAVDAVHECLSSVLSEDATDSELYRARGACMSLNFVWNNIQSLRVCWVIFIEKVSEICASVHDRSQCFESPITPVQPKNRAILRHHAESQGRALGNTFHTIPTLKPVESYRMLDLVLVSEIVGTMNTLVNILISRSFDFGITNDEWEALLIFLEDGCLPWFASLYYESNLFSELDEDDSQVQENMRLIIEIQGHVELIFQMMSSFIDSASSDQELYMHKIADEAIRKRFLLLYFRMICPILPMDQMESIGLSVVKSWVRDDAMAFSSHEWQKRCSAILGESFAIYKDNTSNEGYERNYVHPPAIRQATIRAIVDDVQGREEFYHDRNNTSNSMFQDYLIDKNPHAKEICFVLIPYLEEILFEDTDQNGLLLPDRYPTQPNYDSYGKLHLDSQRLEITAVKVIGDLLQSIVDDRERSKLIGVLDRYIFTSTKRSNNQAQARNSLLSNVLEQNDFGEICKIKLLAVRTLGNFLRGAFNLHSSNCFPQVIDILVRAVDKFHFNNQSLTSILPFQVVCVEALLQLACIRLTPTKKILLVNEDSVISSMPNSTELFLRRLDMILEIMSNMEDVDDYDTLEKYEPNLNAGSGKKYSLQVDSLSWTYGQKKHNINEGEERRVCSTYIDLYPIIKTLEDILKMENTTTHGTNNNDSQRYLEYITRNNSNIIEILRSLSLEMLQDYIQSGLETEHLGFLKELTRSDENVYPFCRLLATCSIFATELQDFSFFFENLLPGLKSHDKSVLKVACCGVTTLLSRTFALRPEFTENCTNFHQESCNAIISAIQFHIDSEHSIIVLLLGTLLSAITTYNEERHLLNDRTKANIVIICHQLCTEIFDNIPTPHLQLLCLQCTAMAVSTMSINELKTLIERISTRQNSMSLSVGTDSSNYLEISSTLLDILIQHCLLKSAPKEFERKEDFTEIEFVAQDIEFIDNFIVQRDTEELVGAWLCNDTILTCRIGAAKSRYKGWVEVMLRSPSARIRKMVRLPNKVSLEMPQIPSNVWSRSGSVSDVSTVPESDNDSFENVDPKLTSDAKSQINVFDRTKRRHTSSIISNLKHGHIASTRSSNNSGDFGSFLSSAFPKDETSINKVKTVLHDLDGSISLLDTLHVDCDEPVPLNWNSKLRRAVNILDRTAYLQTYKIALMYLGPRTTNDSGDLPILGAKYSSPRFNAFCNGLGTLASLKHLKIFSGGLDTSDYASDGEFALCWIEKPSANENRHFIAKTMILFHSVPLMPQGVNTRKRHVGNDFVHILFCEEDQETNGEEKTVQWISGEFCFVTILVRPHCHCPNTVKVTMRLKDGLDDTVKENLASLCHEMILPFDSAALIVRQLAVRADIACRSALQDRIGLFSNWQERLQQIRGLKRYSDGIVGPL
ncbi:hypothetical protein CTEN210_12113 [Chaetoceros tenuissimus]|uniref:Rap-GAP domain-containing protein n=1 Tax=Chaetoceros tenuissimus TaxID=426638 RepID=A0AAD3H9J2_9STRA|nr:hypothetical protein CTEN210_12113 [Chaetoceros tenuissimus]